MYKADKTAIELVGGEKLMENAGAAVVREITKRYSPRYTVVLCGPGNNGGDGFVVARILHELGWQVSVALLGKKSDLRGDALRAAEKWRGETIAFDEEVFFGAELIVDALFGIGLARPIEGNLAEIIAKINQRHLDVVAVDIPSGVSSDTGEVMGISIEAELTVTFARRKVGHVLYPGRRLCGEVVVCDIGIDDVSIWKSEPDIYENTPELWLKNFPFPKEEQHKYSHGHVVVMGGGVDSTGAACLASISSLRAGAGLVTVACPSNAIIVYATKLISVMTKGIDNKKEFVNFMAEKKCTTVLVGPGNGVNENTRDYTLEALKARKSCVIDADAITVFKDYPKTLFDAINSNVVLTPHEGEFKRIFDIAGNKVLRTKKAAKLAGAVIVLKGADTIIASPEGKVAINVNAPPWLATAGSGDVLAGLIAGLMANGMNAFDAACAGVWIHGEAANIAGMGMIAESIPSFIPGVIRGLYEKSL